MYSVLYVDDEPDLLELGKQFLERTHEFSLDTKTSARDGLQALKLRHYDAIVSDYLMPEMNGIAFLKEVRSSYGDIPFIIFTGRGREEVVIEALNNGADFYLQKSSDPDIVFTELRHVIRRAVLVRETQYSIAEQEQRFHDLQNANDLIQSVAPDGHFLFVNQKWLDTLGYQESEVTNLTIFDIIHEESLEHCKELFFRVISGENVGIIDVTFKTRDGKKVYAEGMASCKMIEGKPQYTRGLFKNVTDRKLTEEALRESEEKFRTIFENSPYPISINSIPDGRFMAVNETFRQSSGYSDAEILGKTPVELGLLSLLDCGRLTTHLLVSGRLENVPMALVGKGGTRIHVQFSTIPVTLNDRPAIMTMTAEVTRLKRVEEELLQRNEELHAAYEELTSTNEELRQNYDELSKKEQALRESEEKFRALVEYSLDGILITGFTGNLLFANRAAGLIVDAPDYKAMIGTRNVLEFVAPESQADVLRDFGQVAQGIDAYLVSYKLITEKKREIWVECIGKKIPFREAGAILVSMRDVTERKETEKAVRESEIKFSTVFRSSPVALTLVSATDGTFVDVNDTFVRITGYSRDEVIGKTSEALGIFTDDDERERLFSTLRDQRRVYGMEMHCRIKSGEIRTCLFSSGLIMMGGKPHILSTVEDATERKASESALQAMVRSMVGSTGFGSLRKITENVSSWLGAECVMVGEIQPDRETVKVLSMLLDGKEIQNFSYNLKGTPCDNVAEKGFCLYPDNVTRLFPESRDLAELNIRGYIGTPLRDSGGQVLGILCALSRSPIQSSLSVKEIMDVIAVKAAAEIERTRMEQAFRESQEMLAEAMDLANLVNWEYDVGTGIFTFDDRFYALYGTTAEREGGYRMPADVYAREFVHPDDRGVVAEEVEKAKKTTDPHYVSQREHRIIRRDGEIRQIVVRIGITKDGAGRTIKTHGANQDITDRKKAEEALRENEERFRSFVENANEIVFSLAPDGVFTYISPKWTELLGHDPGEVTGTNSADYIHPDDLSRVRELFLRTMKTGEKMSGNEYRIRHKNGTWQWHAQSGSPIRDAGGNIVAYLGICHDITDRKRAEDALRTANRQLGLLTGITRHDILNKISVALGYLKIAEKKFTDPELAKYLGKMESATTAIRSQIEFTRVYQDLGTHEPQWLELDKVMPCSLVPAAITLKTDVPGISVFADPMLEKVFFNLLDNSIRHGQRVTEIRVSSYLSGEDLVVVWEDNGIGIAADVKERIFERGFGENTGLGMFLVREILALTGITIMENGEPGSGARFEIVVPKEVYRSPGKQGGEAKTG